MKKTGFQFEQDFFNAVKNTLDIKGNYYRSGVRPLGNVEKSEDCIVIFKAGIDDDIQVGYITINVYVPDITFNGSKIKDLSRCSAIEASLNQFAETVRIEGYMIEREGTINTFEVIDTNEHFVHLELKYNYLSL